MSNLITSGTTFQNDLNAANIAANTARQQANIATTQASIATTAATNANLAATRAANSASQASSSASLAAVYANTARTANTISLTSVVNQPAGMFGAVQIAGGNGFTSSGNLVFANNTLNVEQTINSVFLNLSGIATVTSLQANVANVLGNLRVGQLSVLGNVNGMGASFSTLSVSGTILGNGAGLTGVATLNSPVFTGVPSAPTPGFGTSTTQIATTAFVQQAISSFTGISGNSFSVTGNIITSTNIQAAGVVTATGNVTGGNIRTTGIVTATGNITTAGNLFVVGTIQSNGNVTITNLNSSGNVTGANLRTTGSISATGALTAGSVTTGNVTANGVVQAINANVINTLSVSGGIKQNQFTKLGSSAGQPGQIVWDTNYIYVCTATNVWKRVALTSF